MVGYAPITWSGNASLIRSPPEQAPLSSRNAYTTWPGGVDPTVPLYNTDNQFPKPSAGGARRSQKKRSTRRNRKNSRRNRKLNRKNSRKNTRRNRKVNRKNSRRNRKNSRKSRRASRRSRRHRGGYQTCSPIDTLGSRASIPMTASVCPEGYFQDKGLIA
jgi:hypothetical protein